MLSYPGPTDVSESAGSLSTHRGSRNKNDMLTSQASDQ